MGMLDQCQFLVNVLPSSSDQLKPRQKILANVHDLQRHKKTPFQGEGQHFLVLHPEDARRPC